MDLIRDRLVDRCSHVITVEGTAPWRDPSGTDRVEPVDLLMVNGRCAAKPGAVRDLVEEEVDEDGTVEEKGETIVVTPVPTRE